jgi:hypothetical protein
LAGLLPTRDQARRLWRVYREAREQTGSSLVAAGRTGRFAASKIPKFARQARHSLQSSAVLREIETTRDQSPETPLLGIRVSGGLGDYLVIARFLRDLAQVTGPFRFDIYSSGQAQAQWVFGGLDGFRTWRHEVVFEQVFPAYHLAARISQFVILHSEVAQWQQLATWPALVEVTKAIIRFRPKIQPFIEHHPYLDGFLAQKAIYANRRRADFLHAMAEIPYTDDRLAIEAAPEEPRRHDLAPGRYVTIHNGFDTEFFTNNRRATKCYPHFDAVVALLRPRWPDLQFVQIGTHTSEPIPGTDLDLIGATSLKQAAGLIGGALLHLDNEGGLVHLARCFGVPSCVVFGPTPSAYFGYDGNINIDPSFCGGCWWINETWMSQCPRGFAAAKCMTEQDPEIVANAIDRFLVERLGPPDLASHRRSDPNLVAGALSASRLQEVQPC